MKGLLVPLGLTRAQWKHLKSSQKDHGEARVPTDLGITKVTNFGRGLQLQM